MFCRLSWKIDLSEGKTYTPPADYHHMERKRQKLLHGTLEVTIFDATPSVPSFPFNCMVKRGKPAYVTIKLDKRKVATTSHERDRIWNQTFQILCAHSPDTIITISLKTKCSVLGRFRIPAQEILKESSLINGFFPLAPPGNQKPDPGLRARFILWFKPAELEPSWSRVLSTGQFKGLRNATFPQRPHCHVTLYQDVHHTAGFQPPSSISRSVRKLWEDVYRAIDGAKHLVYIAGWSLNPRLVLVRDPETELSHASEETIGELLKRKAEEGVAVRIMLWNDETSLPLIRNKGVMKTHDEDALVYFRKTSVICKLCARTHEKFPTAFTHHQKTITVDTRVVESDSNEREIMSFVGGIDLCDGRYDTERHSLFNTQAIHCDFYQTCLAGASMRKGGPREPWHDCHACVVGEAAWDILTNFEQRWTKQCDVSLLSSLAGIQHLVREPKASQSRNWNVQVYRSIDHISATQIPKNLLPSERSIHEAYVEAIRKAENFIYIENQYFVGGCNLWENDKNCGCTNLVPVEIALKIASKIRAKERFAVYIVMPMWPEGTPESESVQDMLHWTRETMRMMYRLIGEALRESGDTKSHPRDYLNFFCLGNREERREEGVVPQGSPHVSTHYWNAQKNRRFMVYVHSKLMIVDDLYLLIGSANINQRSMDGRRDTEIAIGCYQNGDININNEIRDFRISLWYEHSGGFMEESFKEPQRIECVHRLRGLAERAWSAYTADEVLDMKGLHLMPYPVDVAKDGTVEDLSDGGVFPDTKAPVRGRRAKMLPPILTT